MRLLLEGQTGKVSSCVSPLPETAAGGTPGSGTIEVPCYNCSIFGRLILKQKDCEPDEPICSNLNF